MSKSAIDNSNGAFSAVEKVWSSTKDSRRDRPEVTA